MDVDLDACTDPGPFRSQEDSVWLHRVLGRYEEVFAAVCDGMGGQGAGELAAALVVSTLMEQVASFVPDYDAYRLTEDRRIVTGLEQAHHRIGERREQNPRWLGLAVTAVVMHLGGGQVHIAHVGACRAYRWRAGTLELLTEDHSLINEMHKAGQPMPDDHPFARVVTRTIGTAPNFQATERKEPVRDGDVYLLCSSPLAFVLSSQDIGAVLAQGELSARSMCRELIARAAEGRELAKEGANISVAVARVNKA